MTRLASLLTAVVCETMAIEQLPASIRSELQKDEDEFYGMDESSDPMNTGQPEKTIDLYTCVQWKNDSVTWWQEINKKEIEGTRGNSKEVNVAVAAAAHDLLPGVSSYGPGYIESACIADLQTAEALSQAVSECALGQRPGEASGEAVWCD